MPRSSSTWSCSTSDKRPVDLDIDHLNAAGDGVALPSVRRRWAEQGRRQPDQVITIPFTIPGERVRADVRRLADGTLVGVVEQILRASPHRVDAECPHFGPEAGPAKEVGADLRPYFAARGCGGCTWQHIAYPEQLRLKSDLVTRLVRGAVPRAPIALPTLAGTPVDAPWGYRQKVHFVFGSSDRRQSAIAMGHYARGSRRVVPITTCPVHDERGNAVAFRFRDAFRQSAATAVSALKGLAVRAGANTDESMATLVLTGEADRPLRAAVRRVLEADDRPSSAHVNIHPRGDAYIFGRDTRRLTGSERMREEVAGVSFLISPTAFFQTNVRAAEILVRLVVDAVPHPSRVLDLYAGGGLFALPLARAGDQVVAVEENREAIADGEASRRLNGIDERRCRFVSRRVEDVLRAGAPRLPRAGRSASNFDVVVLDPPRAGCSTGVARGVFGTVAPPLAVYVSCNPEALARDLREAVRFGYHVVSMQPVDMFPHTAHVETVVVLRRSRNS